MDNWYSSTAMVKASKSVPEKSPERKTNFSSLSSVIALLAALTAIIGCRSPQPIPAVPSVDLERFMGDWYVIASIPTVFEKEAFNALESYRLDPDGFVATTFTYNKGSFDGPLKTYTSRGFVRSGSANAVWGMQFVWPFKAEYRIIFLDRDYSQTVIGRSKRDYAWIMARAPAISDADYARMLDLLRYHGYDISQVQKVPQQPLDQR
jgi:apolipoprotein D and lipocalin family protein